jgi:hypothetical protein
MFSSSQNCYFGFCAFHECGAANAVTEKLPEKHDIAKIISTNILTRQFEHSWPP